MRDLDLLRPSGWRGGHCVARRSVKGCAPQLTHPVENRDHLRTFMDFFCTFSIESDPQCDLD